MTLAIYIERRDYDIVIGWPDQDMVTARFVFDGWENCELKVKFHGSISYLDSETAARRNPGPKGVYRVVYRGKGEPVSGAVLEATYNSQCCTPDSLERFFEESGVAVHRAEPFFKPVKSLQQALKDYLH